MSVDEIPGESDYKQALKYYNGYGIPVDKIEGERYLTLAADQGHVESQYELGHMYAGWTGLAGEGVTMDLKKGMSYLELAATHGHIGAINDLITIYGGEAEDYGVPPDMEKEMYYIKLGAEHGDVEALYGLGTRYVDGYIPRDIEKGIEYLKIAADKGYRQAQHTLGEMYVNGEHVPRHEEKGIAYLKAAADQGNAASLGLLGYTYYHGGDKKKGIEYLKMAEEKGHLKYFVLAAEFWRATDIRYLLGLHYIKLAAKEEHSDAMLMLRCLELPVATPIQHAVRVHPGGNKTKNKISKKVKEVKTKRKRNTSNKI